MNARWLIRRLKAMGLRELQWRLEQKGLQTIERFVYRKKRSIVAIADTKPCPEAKYANLGIYWGSNSIDGQVSIELLGDYKYEEFKNKWRAGFQTEMDWPLVFAHQCDFAGSDAPGDVRTNWELNRHYQFVLLAAHYYKTKQAKYLEEIVSQLSDFNASNPFLWGAEWASPMEVSIRLVNWLYTAAILKETESESASVLAECLAKSSWAMANYLQKHYSRYSSANNHTIVEAYGVGVAALVFSEERWLEAVEELLVSEVEKQTFCDGVNKEEALHYQLFVMEALCILAHCYRSASRPFPPELKKQTVAMANYVRNCFVSDNLYVHFGDDDEGVLLNFSSSKPSYPEYVLSLVSLEFGDESVRWVDSISSAATIQWLYSTDQKLSVSNCDLVPLDSFAYYPEGGVSILREGTIVLAFDHGPLGFGSLSAHGHADALSVQLFVNGNPVLVDPGTYIYNYDSSYRNHFRSTRAHNTICVDGKNQSVMEGPFLWGKKANCKVCDYERDELSILAMHDGYGENGHARRVSLKGNCVFLEDRFEVSPTSTVSSNFCLGDNEIEEIVGNKVYLTCGVAFEFIGNVRLIVEDEEYSPRYLKLKKCKYLRAIATGEEHELITVIESLKEG